MVRTARWNCPGGIFHLVSRFARDEWWLDTPGARDTYLDLLGRASTTTDTQVLAYCLMSNHVHLVLVQGEAPLERFTKSLHTAFATWAHRQRPGAHARGPVYAARPRTLLVERETHLLELVRYVHNNPVRAGVVRRARNSRWSSHQAYIGVVEPPAWLRTGYVLAHFGRDRTRSAAELDAFVDDDRKAPRRPELSGALGSREATEVRRGLGDGHRTSDGILGRDSFVARVRADAERVHAALASRGSERRAGPVGRPSVRAVIDAVSELLDLDPVELQERPRSRLSVDAKRLTTWVWVHEYAGRQIDVARALGIDTSIVSRYYGQAIAAAADFDQRATAVTALLRRRGKQRARVVTPPSVDALPVRYHVDVDEV